MSIILATVGSGLLVHSVMHGSAMGPSSFDEGVFVAPICSVLNRTMAPVPTVAASCSIAGHQFSAASGLFVKTSCREPSPQPHR
jgi:hypothetical protein